MLLKASVFQQHSVEVIEFFTMAPLQKLFNDQSKTKKVYSLRKSEYFPVPTP